MFKYMVPTVHSKYFSWSSSKKFISNVVVNKIDSEIIHQFSLLKNYNKYVPCLIGHGEYFLAISILLKI